jgi:hypothetical protein
LLARLGWGGVAAVMLLTVFMGVFDMRNTEQLYHLSPEAEALVGPTSTVHAESLKLDAKAGAYEYNQGYQPGGDVTGQSSRPKFTATFNKSPEKGTTVTDPVNDTSVTFKPDYALEEPIQEQNRLIYPLKKGDATKVYSLKSSGFKEDILLHSFQGDSLTFAYTLELSAGTEARMEPDGSLAVYGVTSTLLGDVATGSSKDEELLKKARENGEKNTLLFRFPAPFIVESGKKQSNAKAWFSLQGDMLTVHAAQLKDATYPLSIDPSVYVETAAKLMRGNNETNVDFDVDGELIQKGSTTGARFDEWANTMDLNSGRWNGGTAVAGGNVYQVGGMATGVASPPVIAGQQVSTAGASTTFTMNLPATRPAGDLYLAIIGHDGTGFGINPPAGGNWTEYADTGEHAAYWKIGENKSAGNEQASYVWTKTTGGTEEWAGVIIRVTGFDSADPISGTPTTNSTTSNTSPTAPSVTPDVDNTLILRAVGVDDDDPTGSWQPTGHTQVAAQRSSSGTGSGSFALASMNTSPAAGNPTGTATFNGFTDSWGASSIAIKPEPGASSVNANVYWAHFNTASKAVESPNPGAGSCAAWCTDAAYGLPDERAALSLVAYNGFLYAMGGMDSAGTKQSTVYVAKLGANGEPARWHPTDPSTDNWVYWYPSTSLSSARSYTAAVAYNNRMYLLGGLTTGNTTVSTVEFADINPNGTLGSWSTTGMSSLPSARYGHTAHAYNDTIYLVGGNSTFTGSPVATVHYAKLNSNGTMNSWVATSSFTTGRMTWGGSFSAIWGGYLYLSGGCSAVNASGNCTAIQNDVQLVSISADGSLASWGSILNITNQRIGYGLVAWRNTLYRVGGCSAQDGSTGSCTSVLTSVDRGLISQDGDASTVATSVASGVAPCSGGAPYNCNLPGTTNIGNMLSATAIMNGYLYIIGGCTNNGCTTTTGNTVYTAIGADGSLTRPAACTGGTTVDAYCVDSTNPVSGGVAAAGTAVFNGRIYIVGGVTGSGLTNDIQHVSVNNDGSLNGTWTQQNMSGGTNVGATSVAYTFAYARANPASAGTNPGNLYIFGGCTANTGGGGCTSGSNTQNVYKCNIATSGSIANSSCTTGSQLQIGTVSGASGAGLAIHSGTVYANYIYLIGGVAPGLTDLATVRYAKFDNNNNVVAASGSAWVESPNEMSIGRRRGASFGYNGYLYAVGGYDGTGGGGVLSDIQFAKINVSNGSIEAFKTSGVTIDQRWGLSVPVSNSYAFVIGGCINGASPTCNTRTDIIQTFQIYNNDSGSVGSFTASAGNFAANTDRWGSSAAILNGYIYVAGGCTSATDCTDATNNVQYAALSASDGSIGSWSSGGNLPADRAWGELETAGGALYYLGGQEDTAANEQSTVYYTTGIASGNPTWSGTAAAGGIGDTNAQVAQARTKFSAATWNNRIYVVGGLDGSAAVTSTVYVSPQLTTGGTIAADSWTSTTAFAVARRGAAVTAYANNLYIFGGNNGANYLNDVQFAQINADGSVDPWTYTTSLPGPVSEGDAFAANGYMYLIGGRSAATTCAPNTLIAPISANTTIATGNNPTGVGEWYETSVRYAGDRYGAAAVYSQGKVYLMGGGCTTPLSSNRHYYGALKAQPQIAKYSRMMDTDTDVFPTKWLLNGLDNSIGARWAMRYRSMTNDITNICATMTTWGQETNFGNVTLGQPENFVPLDGSGANTNCARFFYMSVTIDSSQSFGYPEDISRGPTMTDLSLFFTSDPSKRLRHGKTFTGGEQQPLDTPF